MDGQGSRLRERRMCSAVVIAEARATRQSKLRVSRDLCFFFLRAMVGDDAGGCDISLTQHLVKGKFGVREKGKSIVYSKHVIDSVFCLFSNSYQFNNQVRSYIISFFLLYHSLMIHLIIIYITNNSLLYNSILSLLLLYIYYSSII